MKAATGGRIARAHGSRISIHAAREGGDLRAKLQVTQGQLFQSTPPVKAATIRNRAVQLPIVISIHAAREGGDKHVKPQPKQPGISIHVAREGGDPRLAGLCVRCGYFNPRRP